MSKEEIIRKINGFLSEEFETDAEDIQPDASLKDTLGLDSLDYVDLVVSGSRPSRHSTISSKIS